jgi:hypothetical protein
LVDHQVEFIVIGGISAALNGAPLDTLDVDIVHSRAPENVQKLLEALQELDAYFRIQPKRRLRPNESHLSGGGHQLLTTKYGNIDFLGSVTKQRTYAELLPHSMRITITEDVTVSVLDLEMLIILKEETGREKDRAVLPTLRATLEEIRRRKKKGEPDPEDGGQ